MSSNPLPPADPEQVQRERTEQIARLNDETRQGKGQRSRILFTRGVVELLTEGQTEEPARTARVMINQDRLMRQIADASIDPGDDPYGERDFGVVTFLGERLYWKIDAYVDDGSFSFGSDAPWDASVTIRVLTILQPCEY
ncbi:MULTISPECIES: DUF3768 domain-containing protein [Novosphingobium]|uniref:DUF3768 domain-containing protein n=1 Tax=Novosphingobium TaxID=165696 RepID=UPI00086D4DB6|nr:MULTISPECIES: DUF3768 domain-containing protein [Novosphingobium]ODU77362.1 MAG: hypothetical protein ABT10_24750 [Novosphingobium sp. SCN 63-17]